MKCRSALTRPGTPRPCAAAVRSAADEPLVRAIAIGDLERDTAAKQCVHRALLALLRPEFLQRQLAQRDGQQRRMREDVDRHLSGHRFECGDVRLHVRVGCERRRESAEGMHQGATADLYGVQRPDAVREARHQRRRQLAPQGVVPAEFAAPEHVVAIQVIEIRPDAVHRPDALRDVRRDVVGHRGTNSTLLCELHDLRDGERAVGVCGMRVAVDGAPGHRGRGMNRVSRATVAPMVTASSSA